MPEEWVSEELCVTNGQWSTSHEDFHPRQDFWNVTQTFARKEKLEIDQAARASGLLSPKYSVQENKGIIRFQGIIEFLFLEDHYSVPSPGQI